MERYENKGERRRLGRDMTREREDKGEEDKGVGGRRTWGRE